MRQNSGVAEAAKGRRYWFGPKRGLGWGWSPITWEGWLVSFVSIAAALVVAAAFHGVVRLAAPLGIAAVLTVICLVKGTAPGSGGRSVGVGSGDTDRVVRDAMPDLGVVTRRFEEKYRHDHPERSG